MSLRSVIILAFVCVCTINAQINIDIIRATNQDISRVRNLESLLGISNAEIEYYSKRFEQMQKNHQGAITLMQTASANLIKAIEAGPEPCRDNLEKIKAYVESRKEFFDTEAARDIIAEIKANDAINARVAGFVANSESIKNSIDAGKNTDGATIRNIKQVMIRARVSMDTTLIAFEMALAKEKIANDKMLQYTFEYNRCLVLNKFRPN